MQISYDVMVLPSAEVPMLSHEIGFHLYQHQPCSGPRRQAHYVTLRAVSFKKRRPSPATRKIHVYRCP